MTTSGSLAAIVVGALVIDAGWTKAAQLLVFFFVASIATKIKQTIKDDLMPYKASKVKDQHVKQGRGALQVIATGGMPALCCALRHLPEPLALSNYWHDLYFGLMCCNFADTLASEIGMLSTQTPMHVLHWHGRFKQAGIDGGISAVGCLASVLGGALIGIFEGDLQSIINGACLGLAGSLLDSVLGVVLQSKPQVTEHLDAYGYNIYSHSDLQYDQWEFLNSVVNLSSSLLTAIGYCFVKHCDLIIWPIMSWAIVSLFVHLSYPVLNKSSITVISLLCSASLAFIADHYTWQVLMCWTLIACTQGPFFISHLNCSERSLSKEQ